MGFGFKCWGQEWDSVHTNVNSVDQSSASSQHPEPSTQSLEPDPEPPAPSPEPLNRYRMPAEWEPHEATWIGWPHNLTDWPGKFAPIPWVYGEIVRQIVPGEIVRILVNSKAHEEKARRILKRIGVDLARVEFFRFPTDRGWTRDFGPMFVKRDAPRADVAIARFGFTGWAKYPNWRKDCQVPERAARALRRRMFDAVVKGRTICFGRRQHRRERARHAADHGGMPARSGHASPQPGLQPRGNCRSLPAISGSDQRPLAGKGNCRRRHARSRG